MTLLSKATDGCRKSDINQECHGLLKKSKVSAVARATRAGRSSLGTPVGASLSG